MSQYVLEKILDKKIVAIIRGVSSNQILDVTQALLDGGVQCLEITYNPASEEKSKETLVSIEKVKKQFGSLITLGAGTVLTAEQVDTAVAAGADYIISPNVSEEVIRRTKKLDKVSMPGALTPTEAQRAIEYGADIVKMFPAGILGIEYLKAVKSSMTHLVMSAVGGVDTENIADFINAGVHVFGIGSSLVNTDLVEKGLFDQITERAIKFSEAVKNI